MKNYYQILGLESNASKDEIKRAYRTYASKFHPDKQNGDKFFEERFKEVLEAYQILNDDNKRANYDSKLKNSFSAGKSKYNKQSYSKYEKDRQNEEEKRKANEKVRERKSKVFYTSKDLIVNGMYIYNNGRSYLLDDYDSITLRKDDNSNFVFIGIVFIIIGILTISFFIGFFIIMMGIFGLFHKEYIIVLINEKGDIPLIKGPKRKMIKIAKRIKQAKEF